MSTTAPNDPERRGALNGAKLRALVASHWGLDVAPATVGTGAGLVHDGTAYVLLDGDAGLGAALAIAGRSGARSVHVIAGERAGVVARQAQHFTTAVEVWRATGTSLTPVDPDPVPHAAAPPDAPELVGLLRGEDLDVVVEASHLAGEWLGLEVARILRDDDGVPGLSVGVGRFDRELTAMVHGDLPPAAALHRVVEQVRVARRADAPLHPLRELVPERWLRARLVQRPDLVGCRELVAAPAPVAREGLRDKGIAVATGLDVSGRPVVVAATVGTYLEAVPEAADARAALDPDADLLVACPARDRLPVIERLVADLRAPGRMVGVDDRWREDPMPAGGP